MKIITAINQANYILKKNYIKSSQIDCELLISKAIDKNREYIILNLEKEITKKDYKKFQKLVSERSQGKPIAYLTGKKYFWKDEFDIHEKF